MTAQPGKDLLIKIEEPVGSGTYVSMAGLRARTISLNAQTVDVTHSESTGQWRELLATAGVKSVAVSGSGVFRDETADAAMRTAFFAGEMRAYQIVIPDFGMLQGPFQIAALEYAGDFDGEAVYTVSLASGGAISFTAI